MSERFNRFERFIFFKPPALPGVRGFVSQTPCIFAAIFLPDVHIALFGTITNACYTIRTHLDMFFDILYHPIYPSRRRAILA
ncbi:MAG: hypothetical protein HKP58_20585 [Desulfatitalea sp.]|nr:hypothetical protein [Desulfatitalea sp.]NNK02816.1 hypothetical protein [Desulfatitalea sp.]